MNWKTEEEIKLDIVQGKVKHKDVFCDNCGRRPSTKEQVWFILNDKKEKVIKTYCCQCFIEKEEFIEMIEAELQIQLKYKRPTGDFINGKNI